MCGFPPFAFSSALAERGQVNDCGCAVVQVRIETAQPYNRPACLLI
ncbi:hypothetical protein BIFDEN_00258 [Bifidobacterium dentium ATCC 27678]|nr:hypothetical protein BIFDEN_00258 [Bifidobacterium dentium ATCC 27678]